MLSDVQIAQACSMEPIETVAGKVGLTKDDLELYGKYKAKVTFEAIDRLQCKKDGKLILVTSINPTKAGEGKTTTMIGLAQAMNALHYNTVVAMREPSLGPCFGIKGGAAGGGYAQVVPMDDINLHFTGDIHAVTTANNLISAMLDNSIHQGNPLNIDTRQIVWKRVVDLNDRALRNIVVGLGGKTNGVPREDGFDISVASEIMGALCLCRDLMDLKKRIGRMIVAYRYDQTAVTVNDLQATGAVCLLLKDAIKPNLVQTLDHTPVLMHGGPFANIAHGCNSIIATKLALKLGDYTLTEAGFGADLGAEKFFDIACVQGNLHPDLVVMVSTIRALKMHGGVELKDLKKENVEALKRGVENLYKHIENMQLYGVPLVVAINAFPSDTEKETTLLVELLRKRNIKVAISNVFEQGAKGGIELAKQVVTTMEETPSNYHPLYDAEKLTIKEKVWKIAKEIYGADYVSYSNKANRNLKKCEDLGFNTLPVCIAKIQYSLSDDKSLLGRPSKFTLHVDDVILNAGSKFIVVVCGGMMRMPGLPKEPAAIHIDLKEDGEIVGLF